MECNHISISFLFLLILTTTHFRSFKVEARPIPTSKSHDSPQIVDEEKFMLRAKIGSRPPRCERRCNSCAHCVAIQVPTNPQVHNRNSTHFSNVAYERGDDYSNYMPLSWKCKCGNLIFNP